MECNHYLAGPDASAGRDETLWTGESLRAVGI